MHMEQTRGQIDRLEKVIPYLGESPRGKMCKAMEGVIAEGEEMMSQNADESVLDAALISSAQRVEHYQIAGYGTVRTFARMLKEHERARLLQETLDEEGQTHRNLTQLAESSVNIEAR